MWYFFAITLDGDTFVDAIRASNQTDAMYRAWRNWPLALKFRPLRISSK